MYYLLEDTMLQNFSMFSQGFQLTETNLPTAVPIFISKFISSVRRDPSIYMGKKTAVGLPGDGGLSLSRDA